MLDCFGLPKNSLMGFIYVVRSLGFVGSHSFSVKPFSGQLLAKIFLSDNELHHILCFFMLHWHRSRLEDIFHLHELALFVHISIICKGSSMKSNKNVLVYKFYRVCLFYYNIKALLALVINNIISCFFNVSYSSEKNWHFSY